MQADVRYSAIFADICSMQSHDAFMTAIRTAPEDDAIRLIYADWLDDQGDQARAEFIRMEVRMAMLNLRNEADWNEWKQLFPQVTALWQAHHRQWMEEYFPELGITDDVYQVGPAQWEVGEDLHGKVRWRRGFPDCCLFDEERFERNIDAINDCPIRALLLALQHRGTVMHLLQSLTQAPIRECALTIDGVPPVGAGVVEFVQAVKSAPFAPALQYLSLPCMSMQAVQQLSLPGSLPSLRSLNLESTGTTDAVVAHIADTIWSQLEILSVNYTCVTRAGLEALVDRATDGRPREVSASHIAFNGADPVLMALVERGRERGVHVDIGDIP